MESTKAKRIAYTQIRLSHSNSMENLKKAVANILDLIKNEGFSSSNGT
jgi:hypothetical protein